MAARLESRVKSLLRAGHAEPGRGTIQTLEEGCEEIRQRLHDAGLFEVGYGLREIKPEEAVPLGSVDKTNCAVVRLDASRIDLPSHGATFDAAAWMSGTMRAAFLEPTSFVGQSATPTERASVKRDLQHMEERHDEFGYLLERSRVEPPATGKLSSGSSKLTARQERELCARLDSAGLLRLVPEDEARELADILTVRKSWDDDTKVWRLRLIFDRRRRNAVEGRLPPDAMSALAQGPDLCEIILLPSEELRFDSSDLDNWYYQFHVTADRASTNIFGAPRPLAAFSGLHAAEALQLDKQTERPRRYCAALGTMAMGDHNACEFGQGVHLAVLQDADCAREAELLRLREPIPEGDLIEGIVIDDHGVVYKIPKGRRYTDGPGGRRASEIRVAAARGYANAGIRVKDKKTVIGASNGVLWGAEIRGKEGRIGAQRARR